MNQTITYVISDIHMGTNEATNWYQKDIHEVSLGAILQDVIRKSTYTDELIILGDLFDFWTCPPNCAPNAHPPTAAAIVAANPNILGPDGLLSQVLTALEGRVSYLRGNHDITTTQADLNEIKNPNYAIQLQDDIYVKNGVLYTHGHLSTMFNAPDLKGQPIPVGHFVTRAVSYYLQQNNKHAANEPGFGVPNMGYGGLKTILNEIGFPAILLNLPSILNFSITRKFLDVIQNTTGIPDKLPIKLEGNLGVTTFEEVKAKYENLWSEWMLRYSMSGDLMRGFMFAYKAAYGDYDGSYMGWFAQQLAFEHTAHLVVMGHTHTPRVGLKGGAGFADYINSGFECVPEPDRYKDKMTYTLISTESGKPAVGKVWSVDNKGTHGLENPQPERASIFGTAVGVFSTDYSCYIMVYNSNEEDYFLDPGSIKVNHGFFATLPHQIIPAGGVRIFWMQDVPGPYGTDGEVSYESKSGKRFNLSFKCTSANLPFNRNECGGTNAFWTKSEGGPWGGQNEIREKGNPFTVKFELK